MQQIKKFQRQSREAGDTLIEVLFAFAVLSLVIIGALSIMNQGSIASQRSLETTLVKEEINGQVSALNFLHDAYIAAYQPGADFDVNTAAGQWQKMVSSLSSTTPSTYGGGSTCPTTQPEGSFVLDPVTATYQTNLQQAQTFAQLGYNGSNVFTESDGVWVEGIKSTTIETDVNKKNVTYIDFHVNACWPGPGSGPVMTIGTIVRLYEPVN